jgi:HEAT repeat protein
MIPCPVCQKPVDPLRARDVRVVAARIMVYCSPQCSETDAARGAAPEAVASHSPLASSPPARSPGLAAPPVQEPGGAGAVATKKAGKDAGQDGGAEAVKNRGKEIVKESRAPATSGEPSPSSRPGGPALAPAGAVVEAASDPRDPVAAPSRAGKSRAGSKPGAAVAVEKVPSPAPLAAQASPSRKSPVAPSTSSPSAAVAPTGPVGPSQGSAAVAAIRVGTGTAAETPQPSRRRWWLVLVLLLAAAGTAGALWWDAQQEPTQPPAPPVAAAPAAAPQPPSYVPAEASRRAAEVLRQHLGVESLRVRRVAAAALGRLGDAEAIQTLVDLLPTEQSEIAKLDIAYGLARGGDPRGLEILIAGMRSTRRDVKGDAARLLAALKDRRAESTLSSLMSLSQFRLSAAEQLARIGNKAAIAMLDKIRLGEKEPQDDRLRATIALGYAGQVSVIDPLRSLLQDSRFNVGAAGALAVLGDASARAVLLEQLSISSLRVSAAVALRRLDPAFDAAPILYRLMPDLESSKDTERVAAAEAVLVLTADKAVAERD